MGHKMNNYFQVNNRNMACETMRVNPLAQASVGRGDFIGTEINFEVPRKQEVS
jgi:hypothetical protein